MFGVGYTYRPIYSAYVVRLQITSFLLKTPGQGSKGAQEHIKVKGGFSQSRSVLIVSFL
jgi:hypothetical protein